MLKFIIPVKSRTTSVDWTVTCDLLEGTLRSVFNQADAHFAALVIGHDRFPFEKRFPGCHFLQVDFAPPKMTDGVPSNRRMQKQRQDKSRKLQVGFAAAGRKKSDHLMVLDADDRVSRRLAGFVASNPGGNGWFVRNGYAMHRKSRWIMTRRPGFFKHCGSSHIIRADIMPEPRKAGPEKERQRPPMDYYCLRHPFIAEDMHRHGYGLRPLPFPGVVYLQHEQSLFRSDFTKEETISRRILRAWVRLRPITPFIRREFALAGSQGASDGKRP